MCGSLEGLVHGPPERHQVTLFYKLVNRAYEHKDALDLLAIHAFTPA